MGRTTGMHLARDVLVAGLCSHASLAVMAQADIAAGNYLSAWVDTIATGVVGGSHNTYRVSVFPTNGAGMTGTPQNIYAIFGDNRSTMIFPPAYSMPAPFGVDFGGTNPQFWQVPGAEDAKFDSWLTVGEDQGNVHNQIASLGIVYDSWSTSPLAITDGAIFWMDPSTGPHFGMSMASESSGSKVVVAQLTLPTVGENMAGLVRVNAQGRSYPNPGTGARSEDWEELGLEVRVGHFAPPPPPVVCIGINCGSPPPPPLPPPPPTCQWFSTLSRPSLQQVCSHAHPEVPSSFHWARRPDASTVRCGASRCSMSDTQCCGVPPPVAPPPPPLQQHCRTSAITEACCGHPGQDCSHGAPAVCSGNCRAEVLQFAALCPEVCSWLRVHKGKLCLRTNAQS